jgi:hypothetical protein
MLWSGRHRELLVIQLAAFRAIAAIHGDSEGEDEKIFVCTCIGLSELSRWESGWCRDSPMNLGARAAMGRIVLPRHCGQKLFRRICLSGAAKGKIPVRNNRHVYDYGDNMGAARLCGALSKQICIRRGRVRTHSATGKVAARRCERGARGSATGKAKRQQWYIECRRKVQRYRVGSRCLGWPTCNALISIRDIDDDLKEYDLEHYDDDEEDGGGDPMAMFGNTKNLTFHEGDDEDPYITMDNQEEEDEEREELQILATDNLVLAGRIEDEVAHLEVYVYEDAEDNLYVHHDIMLPAIPLAVEWLDVPVGKSAVNKDSRGNFVAIGTMEPDIELWNLDVVDSMYPDAILGQGSEDAENAEKPKKKKKKKSKKVNDNYHVDAVLSLAANRLHRNLLASSSADKTIKLWDLNTTTCAKSYSYHTDKVCSVAWHPKESTILLSGSYDRTVVAADMRAPDAKAPRWGVESDVEAVRWNPHDPNYLYVSLRRMCL